MTNQLKLLVSDAGLARFEDSKPEHTGPLTMKVWWSNGRETSQECQNYGRAYDVIGGEAHPYEKWEIWGTPLKNTIGVGDRLVVTAGSRALGIDKNAIAYVVEIKALGAEYSHTVNVKIRMARGSREFSLIARHMNRLSDATFNLSNPWRADQKIQVARKSA